MPPHQTAITAIRSAFTKIGSGSVTLDLSTPIAVKTAASLATSKPPTSKHSTHAIITLRNERRKNALSPHMMSQLADVVDTLEDWTGKIKRGEGDEYSGLVGVVLTGEGNTFCSGFDLGVASQSFLTPESGQKFSLLMHDTLTRLRKLPLISVAAVEGYALGGGAELSASCDLRVADPKATIRFVQAKMGVALQMLAGMKPLSGQEAHEFGLADELTTKGHSAKETASKMLDSWALEGFPAAIRGLKQVVSAADGDYDHVSVVAEMLRHEREVFGEFWGARDNLAAVTSRSK
ncbi:enoyl CoA hydratase domain-containing protein 1 [Blyttiomyces sp. JEL0837]|nr:enoyl CoA hydratase domain-containing protein 1 [Blyttiomyces sp. JEL0837]